MRTVFLLGSLFVGLALIVSSAAAQHVGRTLPPPGVVSNPGWLTVTTGPTDPAQQAPQLFAITARTDVRALEPFDIFNGLRKLKPNAALVWATTSAKGGPTHVFKPVAWPPHMADFRVDQSWEGQQLRRIQQRLLWISAGGWRLDVRVYFGTQKPARSLLAAVQAELNRLTLPVP